MTRSPASSARSGVFVSYARKDGEAFALDLRKKLEARHISLWQDRTGMEGGRDWWEQIKEALNHVEYMVLVMTPAAIESAIVRKEWRYARQQGVCVYPVIASPEINIGALPRWMNSVHWYDLQHQEAKFYNDLNTRCQFRRVAFMADDLPEDFVARDAEFAALKSKLLTAGREEPIAITAALRGAGGYGKTTLARAICHDDDIQNAFDDGILWVTLGERPGSADLIGKLGDLIETLSDDRPDFQGMEATSARLQELLADRDILLVIDDVWRAEDLRPFLQGGTRCARLVTTRRADALPGDTQKVAVDQMLPREAQRLIGHGLPKGEAAGLQSLAGRLGEWPLLLKLCNAMLRKRVVDSGQALTEAIRTVNAALDKRGVIAFDAKDAAQRNDAVAKTLEASLAWLSPEDQVRTRELAVFPEDYKVPLAVLERYWGHTGKLDELEVEELCLRLFDASLLLECDLKERHVRLHDTVRGWLIGRADDRARQHVQLLASYLPAGGPWADAPDDGYLYPQLADHLIAAGRASELVTTVRDMRYVVAKAQRYPARMVCEDLAKAQEHAGSDPTVTVLRRALVQEAHMLDRCESRHELEITLASRLHVVLPDAARQVLAQASKPKLVTTRSLPDLPRSNLVRTLAGHANWVNGCAVSPDGQWIVSASEDRTLKIWDARSGEELRTLAGHASPVNGCAVSPDGQWIVSASDWTFKIWDARSGEELRTLAGHASPVSGCAVSPDGQWIVSASQDCTLKIWDARSGEELRTLAGHASPVNGCAVSPDGQWIVSASYDGTLKIWDARSGEELRTLVGHADWVNGCAVSPDGQWIVSASFDGTLKIWDARSGEELRTLAGHAGSVSDCAVSPDGRWIVSASQDWTLKIWDARSGEELRTLAGHAGSVSDCAVSPDGQWIVSASHDHKLKIWDARSGEELRTLAGHAGSVSDCAVSPDGQWIVSASEDRTLKIWDARSGEELRTLAGHAGSVNGCAVSPDGQWIVSASRTWTLTIWDARSGEELRTLAGHADSVSGCAVSPDGQWIVSASQDCTLTIWDARSGEELRTLAGHASPVNGCAVSPDGRWIVSASYDNTLKIWDARSGEELRTLAGHASPVNGCAVSPDGQWIVSASFDGTLKIWDARSGEELRTLAGHAGSVSDCAVSPDGRWIVSASYDDTLKIWDVRKARCVVTIRVDSQPECCVWQPDGRHIVVGGSAGLYWLEFIS